MKLLRLAVAVTALIPSWLLAKDDADPTAAFKHGADLMEKLHFKEAIPFLKQAEKAFPDNPSVLWNLGIASAEVQKNAEALLYWQKFQKVEPENWRAIAKLVQSYQALGDFKARDGEIQNLYKLRAKDVELAKENRFCREQFTVAGRKIFAFEIFEPKGDRRIFYRFAIVDAKGNESSHISLGSYDGTTDFARELGEISNSERMYHIDRYIGNSQENYGLFKTRPSYDEVRKVVVSIIKNKSKMISGAAPIKSPPPKTKHR